MRPNVRFTCGLAVCTCLFLVSIARHADAESATTGRSQMNGPSAQPVVRLWRNVVYGTNDGEVLKLDIYVPESAATNAVPLVMRIHGGAWSSGDKAGQGCVPEVQELLARGYVVASINYRLAPRDKFPAQIEDAKCAVRFLRTHAADYYIDPERIGVWGESAGGHLAALLGLTGTRARWNNQGGWTDVSSQVQAVADLFGPTDLVNAAKSGDPHIGFPVFGVTNLDDPRLVMASPVTYVSKSAPPFLIVQGDRDKLVHLDQSVELQNKLIAAGATSTLLVVKNADHGFAASGGRPTPSRAEIARAIADFFDQALRK